MLQSYLESTKLALCFKPDEVPWLVDQGALCTADGLQNLGNQIDTDHAVLMAHKHESGSGYKKF